MAQLADPPAPVFASTNKAVPYLLTVAEDVDGRSQQRLAQEVSHPPCVVSLLEVLTFIGEAMGWRPRVKPAEGIRLLHDRLQEDLKRIAAETPAQTFTGGT